MTNDDTRMIPHLTALFWVTIITCFLVGVAIGFGTGAWAFFER